MIRNAEMSDFEEIQRIYAYARRFMAKTGNPTQWGTEYPAESLLKKDIELRRLYVVTESAPRPETAESAPHPEAAESMRRPETAGGMRCPEAPEDVLCPEATKSVLCPETAKDVPPHGTAGSGRLDAAAESTRPHGVFMFAIGEDPTYLQIEDGGWLSDSQYGVIHRIAGDGEIHGLLHMAVEYCGRQIHHLRIDTHADNKIMQHTILKNGFVRCGIAHMEDGSPRIAYERI